MAFTVAPAVRAIFDQANTAWPNRSKISDGTIGDTAHSNRSSDHNPDGRGVVLAGDLTHDPAAGVDCNALAEQVKDDPRIKYIIWNRRIYNPSVSRSWRRYTGSNPHDHHMHISVLASRENDTSPWFTGAEEIDMAAADDIIKRIGEFEQDTRKLVTGLIEKEVEAQAQKTRRVVLDLVEAIAKVQGVPPEKVRANLRPETRQILDKVD